MNKRFSTILLILLLLGATVTAQDSFTPAEVSTFGPIRVQGPVLLDSVNLSDKPYSNELLLSTAINFPAPDKFTIGLMPDTAGFFTLPKPEEGKALQLVSFNLSTDRYGKGKITITSPNPLELWIDNVKRAAKQAADDSLHLAGSADASLNGFINNSRVVIKMLTSADDLNDAMVKIEVKPEETDSLLVYRFNQQGKRRIDIKDILEGKRVNGSAISPSGRFVLVSLRETLPGGENRSHTEIYDTQQKRVIFSEPLSRPQLKWMPQSDLLTYTADKGERRTLYSLNPLTMETVIMAENLPKEN
ncbi:MAG: S9 family peptidase, partial [Proteiniphilum sp.]